MTRNNNTNTAPLFGKDDRWSVNAARAVSTVEDAKRYAAGAATVLRTADKRTGEATVAVSLAAYAAVRAGLLKDGREGTGVETMGEYARRFDRAQSIVTRWVTLGHALSAGVVPFSTVTYPGTDKPEFDLWSVLSSKGGADKVGAAIRAEGATVDSILTAVSEHYSADGKRKTEGTTAGGRGKPRAAASETETGDLQVTRTTAEGETETETVSPSKFAVRLAQMLAEHCDKHGEAISPADLSVIGKVLTPVVALVADKGAKPKPRTARKTTAPAA